MRVRGQIWVASRITPQEVIAEGVRKKMLMGGRTSWHGGRGEAGTVYRGVLKPPMTTDFTPQFRPHFCLTALQSALTTVPSHPELRCTPQSLVNSPSQPPFRALYLIQSRHGILVTMGDPIGEIFQKLPDIQPLAETIWGEAAALCGLPNPCENLLGPPNQHN